MAALHPKECTVPDTDQDSINSPCRAAQKNRFCMNVLPVMLMDPRLSMCCGSSVCCGSQPGSPARAICRNSDTECPALRAISSPVFVTGDQNLQRFCSEPFVLLVCWSPCSAGWSSHFSSMSWGCSMVLNVGAKKEQTRAARSQGSKISENRSQQQPCSDLQMAIPSKDFPARFSQCVLAKLG